MLAVLCVVKVYKGLDYLEHAANLSIAQIGINCESVEHNHNLAKCKTLFTNGQTVLGAAILWVGWNSPSGGNWWF